MPQYDLRDDFNGNLGARCISCRVAPQIMRPEVNVNHTTCLGYHFPCGLLTNRGNSLLGLNVFFPDLAFQSVGESLGDEYKFLLSTTFGIFEGQSPFMNIDSIFSKKNDEVAAVSDQMKWAEIYRNRGDCLTFRAIRVYIITY